MESCDLHEYCILYFKWKTFTSLSISFYSFFASLFVFLSWNTFLELREEQQKNDGREQKNSLNNFYIIFFSCLTTICLQFLKFFSPCSTWKMLVCFVQAFKCKIHVCIINTAFFSYRKSWVLFFSFSCADCNFCTFGYVIVFCAFVLCLHSSRIPLCLQRWSHFPYYIVNRMNLLKLRSASFSLSRTFSLLFSAFVYAYLFNATLIRKLYWKVYVDGDGASDVKPSEQTLLISTASHTPRDRQFVWQLKRKDTFTKERRQKNSANSVIFIMRIVYQVLFY